MTEFIKSIALALALITLFSSGCITTATNPAEPEPDGQGIVTGYSHEGTPAMPGESFELVRATEPSMETIPVETTVPTDATEPVEPEVAYFDVPLSEDLQDYIFEVCETYDIDPAVVVAVIWRESTYRADAMGDNGKAYGLMQVQPRWHRDRMKRLGVTDLLDPYQNILVGVDYLAELYHDRGSMKWALMGYNGGPDYANRMTKAGRVSSYASAVLKKSKELK